MRVELAVLIAAAACLDPGVSVAFAQETQPKAKDPNERICETIVPTGSRLGKRKVCATRAEWAEQRKQDRDAIDKAQLSPCVYQSTGATGRPAC